MHTIEELNLNQVHLFREHMQRHLSHADDIEGIVYHPVTSTTLFDDTVKWDEDVTKAHAISLDKRRWNRTWVIKNQSKIIAHVQLKGGHIEANFHRVHLGIGIEKDFRGKGLGLKLMNHAILWARDNHFVWMDLYVHTHNSRAFHLYKKLGFGEIGTLKDAFRVNGKMIDDTHMALKL